MIMNKIIVAISGGIDSVVLAHRLRAEGYALGLAHCNFGLRGAESDGDADFVRQLALDWGFLYYEKRFDTTTYATEKKVSIQMAARELRYAWLEELRAQEGYTQIATAHHLDDSIETFLMNLLQGCGIRGLQGIRREHVEKHIVRPLSDWTREQIVQYAQDHQLTHREDSSNAGDDYLRNRLRHQLVPLLRQFNPRLADTFRGNLERLHAAEWLYDYALDDWRARAMQPTDTGYRIDIHLIKTTPIYKTLLFEFLHPFGFHIDQIELLLAGELAGAYMDSPSHRLLRDRGYWLLEPQTAQASEFRLELNDSEGSFNLADSILYYKKHTKTADFKFNNHKNTAYFNAARLGTSLRLRHWQQGDLFQPFGMQGRQKKVSDVLKNQHLSQFDKARLWILEAQTGEIAWLLGLRTDERFRVEEGAEMVEMRWER